MKVKKLISTLLLSFLILCSLVPASASEVSEKKDAYSFTDTYYIEWARDIIEWNYEKGLMNGVTKDKFAPYGEMNRAMAATVIYRLSSEKHNGKSSPFKDVPQDAYYVEAVSWAYENKIILGTSQNSFNPEANITREDFATILRRYDRKFNKSTTDTTISSTSFPDESQISEHAKDAVCWCYENKIMTGYRDGSFGPKEYITRVQISAVLFNYDNVDHDKLFNIEINNIDKIIINSEKSILGNNGYITEKNKATVYPDKQKEIIEKIINSLNSFDYVSKDTTSRDEWIYSIEIFEKDKEEPILNIKLAKTQVSITLDEVHFRVDHIFYISDTENKYIDVAWLDKVIEKYKE